MLHSINDFRNYSANMNMNISTIERQRESLKKHILPIDLAGPRVILDATLLLINGALPLLGLAHIKELTISNKDNNGFPGLVMVKDLFPGNALMPLSVYQLPDISCFQHLEILRIENISNIAWLNSLGNLPKLVNLTLENCFIIPFSSDSGWGGLPPSIKTFRLIRTQTTCIPLKWIEDLINVQYVEIVNCPDLLLTDDIGGLINLQSLKIERYRHSLPNSILKLKKLTTLSIEKGDLTTLPNELCNIESLEVLYLSDNQLSKLPQNMSSLSHLTKLILENNPLSSLSSDSVVGPQSLTELDFRFSHLTAVPFFVTNLTNLLKLDLSATSIIQFRNLTSLSSLKTLFMDGMKLKSIPKEVGYLAELEILTMCSNQLTNVPYFIAELKKLRVLNLTDNLISFPPNFLAFMPALSSLEMGSNPLEGEFRSFAEAKGEELLRYCKRLYTEDSVPQTSCNLIVIGRGEAGKTTILNSIAAGIKDINSLDVVGEDVEVPERTKLPSFSELAASKEESSDQIVWRFTDLPGQAEYFATYSHFISIPYAIILIVCSLKHAIQIDSSTKLLSINYKTVEEDCRLWCSMVNHLTKSGKRVASAETFLVLSHYDLLEKEELSWQGEVRQWERGVAYQKQQFEGWWLNLSNHIPTAYFAAKISSKQILCLNARKKKEVTTRLWDGILRPAGEKLLKNQMTPRYFVSLKRQFKIIQDQIFPFPSSLFYSPNIRPYMRFNHVREIFQKPPLSLPSMKEAEEAISYLIILGQIIELCDGQLIVLSPLWLSNLVSRVVMPSSNPFNGLPMNNGIVTYPLLLSFLMNSANHNDGVCLFNNELEVKESLDILSDLDIIIQKADLKEHLWQIEKQHSSMKGVELFKSLDDSSSPIEGEVEELSRELIFIPSRMDRKTLKCDIPNNSYVYGRRLLYRNDPYARFPPAIIPLIICWIGGFSQTTNWEGDCSHQTLHLVLGMDSAAYICLDQWHRWLHIIIWALPADLNLVIDCGPKLIEAVKYVIAYLGYQNQTSISNQSTFQSHIKPEQKTEKERTSTVSIRPALESLDNFVHEEKLCASCILEELSGSSVDYSKICTVPPSSALRYRDTRGHDETMQSLEFPIKLDESKQNVSPQQYWNMRKWTPLEVTDWIIKKEPLLAHFFKNSRIILKIETILNLPSTWNELDSLLAHNYRCTARSLRFKLLDCILLLQQNAPPVESDKTDNLYPPFQNAPMSLNSVISSMPALLHQKICDELNFNNVNNWEKLAGFCDVPIDIIDKIGFRNASNPTKALFNHLSGKSETVGYLRNKLEKIDRSRLVKLINEEIEKSGVTMAAAEK